MKHLSKVLLIIGLTLLHLPVRADQPKITTVQGSVTLNGTPAETGDHLSESDVLKAYESDTSYVDVSFPDGHLVRFKGANVKLNSIGNEIFLKLERGKAFPSVETEVDGQTSFQIKTPQAIMGIRGTKFFTQVTDRQTYACVCEGQVSVQRRGSWNSGVGRIVTIPAGFDLHFFGNQPLSPPKLSPQMVTRTWNEFAKMGLEVPEPYRSKLPDVSSP
ncbi:MAG: FecR domain-containing protein [bacterium]